MNANSLPIEMIEPAPPISGEELDAALAGAANQDAPRKRTQMMFDPEQLDRLLENVRSQERFRLVNTPETADFIAGVALEAAHQRERWGKSHDEGKTPFDWVFLIGHLATRAAMHLKDGDMDKALHHAITTAAACANWHLAMQGKTDMRPGIAGEQT